MNLKEQIEDIKPIIIVLSLLSIAIIVFTIFMFKGNLYVEDITYTSPLFFLYDSWVLIISLTICTEARYLSLPKKPLKKNENIIRRVIEEKLDSYVDVTPIVLAFYSAISFPFFAWVLIQNITYIMPVILHTIISGIKVATILTCLFGGLWLAVYLYLKLNALKYYRHEQK